MLVLGQTLVKSTISIMQTLPLSLVPFPKRKKLQYNPKPGKSHRTPVRPKKRKKKKKKKRKVKQGPYVLRMNRYVKKMVLNAEIIRIRLFEVCVCFKQRRQYTQ